MILPDIPRLYTALAEILGAVLYAQAAPSRTTKPVYWGITAGCGALLAAFLYLTGDVPAALVDTLHGGGHRVDLSVPVGYAGAENADCGHSCRARQGQAGRRTGRDGRRHEAENKTGSPVLDTLLTAKSMYCQQHGINLTCVADGTLLNFLTTGEICTIVGTALDNATESVLTEQDPEKRLIRVAVYAQNGFVMLQFENYCAQPVELGPDGLPRQSSHGGYDLKSVRAAAETHGGTVTLHWENEWFTLRVLLPQKNEL